MYRTILLCTDGSPAADVASEYAIWFAQSLGAKLRALYITDIRLLEGPMLADLSGAVGAQPYPALLPQIQTIQQERATMVLDAVDKRASGKCVPCEGIHRTGGLLQTMLDEEQTADLVVLGQRGEHAPWHGEMLGSGIERMVRASIKPCLVTPDKFREINHVLLAYDGSAESDKALRAGIELAAEMDAALTIVTVCQREQEEAASKFLHQAQQQAVAKHLKTEAQLLHGHPETEILAFAEKVQADMITMGAYGHTRIREFILGSTTSHVIRKALVPVLLARG